MSDLVEQLDTLAETNKHYGFYGRAEVYAEAAARITELETALAEAEGRVKDQIVNAIKTHPNFGDEDFGPGLDLAISIATAGEWKK